MQCKRDQRPQPFRSDRSCTGTQLHLQVAMTGDDSHLSSQGCFTGRNSRLMTFSMFTCIATHHLTWPVQPKIGWVEHSELTGFVERYSSNSSTQKSQFHETRYGFHQPSSDHKILRKITLLKHPPPQLHVNACMTTPLAAFQAHQWGSPGPQNQRPEGSRCQGCQSHLIAPVTES